VARNPDGHALSTTIRRWIHEYWRLQFGGLSAGARVLVQGRGEMHAL
jgi:hypothetical protein